MENIMFLAFFVCIAVCLFSGINGNRVFQDDNTLRFSNQSFKEKEDWGYVTVRPQAHMFWWLYYTQAPSGYQNVPLIIWLQGGPGGSSTGFGNFGELGPLDVDLKPRSTTWLSVANLLFIDNPVGAGFSYAETDDAYTTDVDQIAEDLLVLLTQFMKKVPDFEKIPLYIFSESYGGKMTAAFSQVLYKASASGSITCDFRGLAMGDSWISALDYVLTWGPYLYVTSLVDEAQLAQINATAMATKAAYDAGNYTGSTALWGETENLATKLTGGVNFYNILKWNAPDPSKKNKEKNHMLKYGWAEQETVVDQLFARHVGYMLGDDLDDLMNGPIRKKLGVIPDNVTWGGQSGKVFSKQSGDFMKPVIEIVDELLKTTQLEVVVYNGQLDLICDTLGTELWVQKLKWEGLSGYNQAKREAIKDESGAVLYYLKKYENFRFYWILDAGHMVPADAGSAALLMVEDVIKP